MKKLIFFTAILFLIIACVDFNDPAYTDKKLQTSVYLPLISGETGFKLYKIIPTDSSIKLNGKDYEISIKTASAEVTYNSSDELFGSNTIAPKSISFDLPNLGGWIPAGSNITLPTGASTSQDMDIPFWTSSTTASVDSILMSGGNINLNVTSTYTITMSKIYFEIVGFLKDSIDLETQSSKNISLLNKKMKLTANSLKIKFKFIVKSGATTKSGNKINVGFSINNPNFKTIWGKFPNLKINMPSGTSTEFDVPIPSFGDYQDVFDKISVYDVKFGLYYETTLGMKAKFRLNLQQQEKNSSLYTPLVVDSMVFLKPSSEGQKVTGYNEIAINKLTLNIAKIKLDGSFGIEADSKPDFITFPFTLKYTPKITIPLKVKLDNIEHTFSQKTPGDFDKATLKSAQLKFKYNNTIGFNVGCGVYIMKDNIVTDSIKPDGGKYLLGTTAANAWDSCYINFTESALKKFPVSDSLKFKLKINSNDNIISIDTIQSFRIKAAVVINGDFEIK